MWVLFKLHYTNTQNKLKESANVAGIKALQHLL